MLFKSEAQRRFFHAATQPGFRGDADISKKDATKWENETPKNKKLPERVKEKTSMDKTAQYQKIARHLGKLHAMKTAGLGGMALRHGMPALAGSMLAGPGYGLEGALAGAAAGHFLAPGALKRLAEKAPSVTKALEKDPKMISGIAKGLAGAGGGYAAGRLLGARNPYGLQPVFPGLGRENPMGLRPE